LTTGQSYRIDDREFTRADLEFLEAQIDKLETKIASAQAGGKLKFASAVFGGRS
jgi:hypothetical protein